MASSNSTSNDSPNKTGEEAFADPSTNPDLGRNPQVGEAVTSSFDERTSVTQPFVQADGTQDNGAPDLSEPEGARRVTSREGDKTTVEETDVAIKEGTIVGAQRVNAASNDEPGKNPVATEPDTGAASNVDTQGKSDKAARKELSK